MSGRSEPSQLEAALSSSGVEFEASTVDGTSIIENVPLAILFANGESLAPDSRRVYEVLKVAERCAREHGLTVPFETVHDALEKLANRKVDAVITLHKINKTSVREAGLSGRLLPHKVTRHIIPARPLGVRVLLGTLTNGTMPLQEANRQFIASLRTRVVTRRSLGLS